MTTFIRILCWEQHNVFPNLERFWSIQAAMKVVCHPYRALRLAVHGASVINHASIGQGMDHYSLGGSQIFISDKEINKFYVGLRKKNQHPLQKYP